MQELVPQALEDRALGLPAAPRLLVEGSPEEAALACSESDGAVHQAAERARLAQVLAHQVAARLLEEVEAQAQQGPDQQSPGIPEALAEGSRQEAASARSESAGVVDQAVGPVAGAPGAMAARVSEEGRSSKPEYK